MGQSLLCFLPQLAWAASMVSTGLGCEDLGGVAETSQGRVRGVGVLAGRGGQSGQSSVDSWAMRGWGAGGPGGTLRPESAEMAGDRGKGRGSQGKVPGCE